MLGRLQGAGYRLVADAKQADVVVVNTCAFIDRAKQESVDTILEMAREKETGRAQRLVVTGCLTQRYDAELRKEIPEIDATLGTGQVEGIVRAVSGEATSLDGGGAGAAHLGLRPHGAPRPLDPALARLREDQRGLRLHVLLLHHPDPARAAPQPGRRGHRGGGAGPRRARACARSCSWPRTRPATASTTGCATGSPTCCAGWAGSTGSAGSG